MSLPFTIHVMRTYPIEDVDVTWHDSPFAPVNDVVAVIAPSWNEAQAEAALNGRDLFPGALTRLIHWSAESSTLRIDLGPTDYRAFVGTNLRHPELAERFGDNALANPLGLSIAVITADNQIVIQKRSEHVFELPGFFHVGGGNVEPVDVAGPDAPGIVASVYRELEEELAITADQITQTVCLGLAENAHVHKPELLIATWVSLTANALAPRTNTEYSALVFLPDEPSLSRFVMDNVHITSPVAIACLLAVGQHEYGSKWFKMCGASVHDSFGRNSIDEP